MTTRGMGLIYVAFLSTLTYCNAPEPPETTKDNEKQTPKSTQESAEVASTVTTAKEPASPAPIPWPKNLPVYDHIVIVVEENKDYDEIVGSDNAPYINDVLVKEGALFTKAYGEEHFSQGNYFWLFSGSDHNIGFVDSVPTDPIDAPNLGQQLIAKGLGFKGYAESLPEIGSTVDKTFEKIGDKEVQIYGRKHVPWISFSNVPNGSTVETSSNLTFGEFPDPEHFDSLPTVAFVIPNLENDMHNCDPVSCPPPTSGSGRLDCCIQRADQWLKEKLDPYLQWAKEHNSLLIVTFDENDDLRGYKGLTNPMVDPDGEETNWPVPCSGDKVDETLRELCEDMQNRICTVFAGAHIKPGEYTEGSGITHVNILRTLEAMYGLPKAGAQQPNAVGAGILDDDIITDVFEPVEKGG